MIVAVTGADGFVGRHIRCALRAAGIEARPVQRQHFESLPLLAERLEGVDAVVHTAGMNRGEDTTIEATNIHLAEMLREALAKTDASPVVVHINSTHIDRDTAYGRSKRTASEILASTCQLVDLVVPGVFGEGGRPRYNSVVSTFCAQLAEGAQLTVNNDAGIELIHAQDLADAVIESVTKVPDGRPRRLEGTHTSVGALANKLAALHETYASGVVPDITDSYTRALFNTLRSYRPSGEPIRLEPRSDNRGTLVELVKAQTGGQMFISTTHPGVTRGNHFHRRKVERFIVVGGMATIAIRHILENEVVEIAVTGDDPVAIDIPTLHTHNIVNTGQTELTTVFWANEIFDPEHPDTFAEAV